MNTATYKMSDSKINAVTNAATNDSGSSKIESSCDIKHIMECLSKFEKLPEELVNVKNTLIHIEQFMESANKDNIELWQINMKNTARIGEVEAENNQLKVKNGRHGA